jgi:hypothetical protein
MTRDVWIMAAWMVQKYGPAAPMAVQARLAEMERAHADEHQVLLWCQIGRAVLEIVRVHPEASETIH